MRLLVTGAAGFIGNNFVRYWLGRYQDQIVVLDKLTYAGNPENLLDLESDDRFRFVRGDIADAEIVDAAMDGCDWVVNFAAESHVDRSILDPSGFITTDVYGAHVLLETARKCGVDRFLQVSTDEVYGAVPTGASLEADALRPRSPYAASKAGGELLVYAYYVTYGLPTLVTRGSNTFGPRQYPEKLIPVVITEALDDRPIPVYGDGRQVRDWLFVEDHCSAIDSVLRHGEPGNAYNVGAGNERFNVDVVQRILDTLGRPRSLIQHIPDRPGHDLRYCVDAARLRSLGWRPSWDFDLALEETVRWYVDNEAWWRQLKSRKDYVEYFERNYRGRLTATGAPASAKPIA